MTSREAWKNLVSKKKGRPNQDIKSMFSIIAKQNAEKYNGNDKNESVILNH